MKTIIEKIKSGDSNLNEFYLISNLDPIQKTQMIEIFSSAIQHITDDEKYNELLFISLQNIYTDIVNCSYSTLENKLLLYNLLDVQDISEYLGSLYISLYPSFSKLKYSNQDLEFIKTFTRDYMVLINKQISEKYHKEELTQYLKSISRDKKINKLL